MDDQWSDDGVLLMAIIMFVAGFMFCAWWNELL